MDLQVAGAQLPRDVPHRSLSWCRTIDRELVHRTSVAEVLVTDVRQDAPGDYAVAAVWSRSHPTFPRAGDGRHSPLVLVETLRQLGICIPLQHYAVPADSHFLISDLAFSLDPEREPRIGGGITEVTCAASVSRIRLAGAGKPGGDSEGRRVTGMRLDVRFSAGSGVFARAGGGVRFIDGTQYAAIRGHGASSDAPYVRERLSRPEPQALALASSQDVLLAHGRGTLVLRPADMQHPFFFDHPSDHMPGMVLLEAARQAVSVRSEGALQRPVGCRLTAARFTELAPSTQVEAVPHGSSCIFRFRQSGEQTAFGVLRYA